MQKITDCLGIALSKRQAQCLYYLLRGRSAVAIAQLLGLSPKTVEYYLDEIKNKLMCKNRAELIEYAIARGFIAIDPFDKT